MDEECDVDSIADEPEEPVNEKQRLENMGRLQLYKEAETRRKEEAKKYQPNKSQKIREAAKLREEEEKEVQRKRREVQRKRREEEKAAQL